MKKFIHDNENGLDYEPVGDYYLPLVTAPKSPKVGTFGRNHLKYLQAEKKTVYSSILISGKLNAYIEDIERQANDMFSQLVNDLAEKENVTEKLKAENQMMWVQKRSNIRNRAMEIVNNDLIYA